MWPVTSAIVWRYIWSTDQLASIRLHICAESDGNTSDRKFRITGYGSVNLTRYTLPHEEYSTATRRITLAPPEHHYMSEIRGNSTCQTACPGELPRKTDVPHYCTFVTAIHRRLEWDSPHKGPHHRVETHWPTKILKCHTPQFYWGIMGSANESRRYIFIFELCILDWAHSITTKIHYA